MLPELLLCILLLSKCNGLILKKIIGNMKSFSKTSSKVQHAALVNTLDAIWGTSKGVRQLCSRNRKNSYSKNQVLNF